MVKNPESAVALETEPVEPSRDFVFYGPEYNYVTGAAYSLLRGINGYSGIKAVKFKIAATDVKNSWGGVYNTAEGKLEK